MAAIKRLAATASSSVAGAAANSHAEQTEGLACPAVSTGRGRLAKVIVELLKKVSYHTIFADDFLHLPVFYHFEKMVIEELPVGRSLGQGKCIGDVGDGEAGGD